MRTSWTNVDLTRIPELQSLVGEARALPTGRAVMDAVAERPTSLRIHADAAWDADPTTADRAGTFNARTNTMHLPERVLHSEGSTANRRDDLLTFVHESVHRTQQPARFARAAYALESAVVAPWRRVAHGVEGSVEALRHGRSPVQGARAALERDVLQVEVEAFDVEQRLALEMARRDGTPLPPQLSADAIAAAIRPDYTAQIRRNLGAGAMMLGAQGTAAVLGVQELRERASR